MTDAGGDRQRYLVTSALPYANGPIHFGHVAGAYLPADVYVRWLRMVHGREQVLYVCGTDEHGVAITLGAEREGVGYREYVDRWHDEIAALFERFRISFDIFTGTARCPQHVEASQRFFEVLREREHVFERTEEQWYSEASGRFLADRHHPVFPGQVVQHDHFLNHAAQQDVVHLGLGRPGAHDPV